MEGTVTIAQSIAYEVTFYCPCKPNEKMVEDCGSALFMTSDDLLLSVHVSEVEVF